MKELLLDNITNKIKDYYKYDEVKLKEIRYGLETLYISIVKLLVVFVISIFIHTTKELCIFYISFSIIRMTGFGLHAKNSLECWVLTIPSFTLIPYLIKKLLLDNYYYLLLIPFIFLLAIYAPADTEKRPLISNKKRRTYKVLTITITMIYFITTLLANNYLIKNSLSFAIILEAILILPISYKLLNLKYANYMRYRRKEVT